jgi:protein O-mannosyl-transferase
MSHRAKPKRPEPLAARSTKISAGSTLASSSPRAKDRAGWALLLIVVVTVLAYLPAIRGGLLWDDDGHVTRPELRSLDGLRRIWFELGATQQYYPLLHSAFWLEYKLWGDNTIGYHFANVLQHAAAACLVYAVLLRLKVPGALLAAAIFAVHPIEVESVAWISEQKNTLSALFYLTAMLAYLRFDESRLTKERGGRVGESANKWYASALVLFVLGLLTKTVTATLPAALLVIFWWRRGVLSWRRDVLPLAPFFLLGAAAGSLTAWVERTLIGAEGAAYELTFLQRGLIAGRAIWFYLAKILWPSNLVFIYPRWNVNPAEWWQWLFPLATLAALGVLWTIRGRWRAPLAGALFFAGTLLPALGFLNVYPFVFSFIADHFQYLAGLGFIALVAAGLSRAIDLLPPAARPAGNIACAGLVVWLAVLTMFQSSIYGNVETLYRTTIRRNPECWMAYNNLAAYLTDHDRDDEAEPLYREAIRLRPEYPEALMNLGVHLAAVGRPQDAISLYERALAARPDYAEAELNWGNALVDLKRPQQAIEHFQAAVRLKPELAMPHYNWANTLRDLGDESGAVTQYQESLRLKPDFVEAHFNLGLVFAKSDRLPEAIEQFQAAVRLRPEYADAHHNLGVALTNSDRDPDAVEQFEEALRLDAHHFGALTNLTKAYARLQKPQQAMATAQKALGLARSAGQDDLAQKIEAWLANYRSQQAKGEPPAAAQP